MEKGKWIFLIDKLPTEVSPPAMSIHYAVPWPMKNSFMDKAVSKRARSLRQVLSHCEYVDIELLNETEDVDLWDFLENDKVYEYVQWECMRPDLLEPIKESDGFLRPYDYQRFRGAMQIKFAGENIRVFPEEFSDVSLPHMKEYLEIYTFHPNDFWNGLAVKPTDPDEKFIFEAALLDGCNEYQATNILNGGDADSIDNFPAPMGWYECPVKYGLMFGKSEEDMKPRYRETA